jgi:hypothetical protein
MSLPTVLDYTARTLVKSSAVRVTSVFNPLKIVADTLGVRIADLVKSL